MKLIRQAILYAMFTVPFACAPEAPELPTGKTIADVTFDDAGNMLVAGYCVTCCDGDWVPGPEIGCDPNPGGGGGPAPHPWCPPPDVYCDGP